MTDEMRAASLKLPPKKELLANLLASGATQAQAGRHPQVAVTKQTVTKWLKDPRLRARVDELRTDLDRQAQEIIEGGVVRAAETVVGAANGELDDDPKVLGHRLRAALWILDNRKKKKVPPPDTRRGERSADALAELADREEAEEWLQR